MMKLKHPIGFYVCLVTHQPWDMRFATPGRLRMLLLTCGSNCRLIGSRLAQRVPSLVTSDMAKLFRCELCLAMIL